jgi:hypothetical protein
MEYLVAETRDHEREIVKRMKSLWVQGSGVYKQERAFQDIQTNFNYVEGSQEGNKSQALSRAFDNKIQKVVLEMTSALTDVRPIWNYETYIDAFKPQGEILNKLARGWWRSTAADRKLQSALMFSACGGSGFLSLHYDADVPGGGDLVLTPHDPRDVIPIDPIYSDSIQDWRGVIIRSSMPYEQVAATWPAKAHLLQGDLPGSWEPKLHGKKRRILELASTAWDNLTKPTGLAAKSRMNSVDVMRIYIKDDTINTGNEPVMVGDPTKNWSYWVHPVGSIHPKTGRKVSPEEAKLYPRGKLLICTPQALLWEGPNPYWHGMFPIVRLTLDPLPWTLLGSSVVSQLIPLQDGLNEALRGANDGVQQWIRPPIIADKNAVAKGYMDTLDSRKAGMKALINPTMGEGFKIGEGPNLPAWYMNLMEFYKKEMEENSGVKGLQQMQQMKQMPNSDNLDKYTEALSPLLRLRARSIELSLSELAEMLKVGFFQYYTTERRVQSLGRDGITLEDFDYDPATLVPANSSDEKEQTDRSERAQKHHKNFSFSIAPNSFLNVSHTTHRMMMLQLFRAQGLDIYSVWESMDLPKIGPIPAETIPERMIHARKLGLQQGPTPEQVAAQEAAAIAQAQAVVLQTQMMQMQMQMSPQAQGLQNAGLPPGGGGPPGGGPPAQGGNPHSGVAQGGGRPPTGQQPPQMINKGGRVIISESGK